MKLRGCAAGSFILLAGIAAACSSKTSQPPIDTSGSTQGGGGGGAGPAGSNDAGDNAPPTASEDAATDASNECLSSTCLGCCTALNECLPGNVNTSCGFNNGRCTPCSGTQTCISGGCE
jgi:hypothetical protein